ncbi:hypothetical protein [Burkholderia orbicola]|uniref:hypothetical protein n=1 Tax=Burkholderia orbicola TaxID=2978683 RepID=UPI00264C96F9|nr:hypothetical protein [Burkholderia orbicola]ELW9446578.1 hypothetical protein [Burkholderia cenocepacia]MDN7466839.1 hypothetical protein [Burkholderia orbicola]
MSGGRQVSFANFICKFGEKNLLDVAEDIVLPAFLDCDKLKPRSYSDTRYFFYQTQLLNLGSRRSPVLAIAGRFIKDTTLRSEQVFENGRGLVRKVGSLDSAPSAIFVLLLNSHKIIYCPETAHSPSISSFRSTAYNYIRQSQNKFIQEEYDRRVEVRNLAIESGDDSIERVTKKKLWEEFPLSTLDVVPIPSALSLSEFIKRYRQLSSISLRVLQTNSELDNSKLLEAIRTTGGQLGAKNSQITHSAGDNRTLDTNEAVVQLRAVAMDGNVDVRLSGKDSSGNKLIGNNEEFRLRVETDGVSRDVSQAALQLNNVLNQEIRRSNIRIAQDADPLQTEVAVRRIARKFDV